MRVYVNIGSNLGDTHDNIERAVALVESKLGCQCHRSRFVESVPWGYDSPNKFLNIAIAFETQLAPLALLHVLKSIEREMGCYSHRDEAGNYADRLIDLDIMAIDGVEMDTPELTIPHKHLWDRTFFYEPYEELRKNLG